MNTKTKWQGNKTTNEKWISLRGIYFIGLAATAIGIGLHRGQVLAANIGSSERLSYALVGDTVNLASRLQGLSKELGRDIILSSSTRNALGDEFRCESLETVQIKGMAEIVKVFALSGMKDRYRMDV